MIVNSSLAEEQLIRFPQMDGDDWYVYGDLVVDRLLGVQRATKVEFCYRKLPFPPDLVKMLNTLKKVDHSLTDQPHRVITSLDAIVLTRDGDLRNLQGGSATLPRRVDAFEYDLRVRDVVRLWHVHKGYPEIRWEPKLLHRLRATVDHLLTLAPANPDVDLLLMEYSLKNL